MMLHKEHSILSNSTRINDVIRICIHCGAEFKIKGWRLKDPQRGKYCSQKCYHDHGRSDTHKKNISEGLKKAYKEGRR